jgi:DNA-directed RNA polymerase specialized sigma24 family protein
VLKKKRKKTSTRGLAPSDSPHSAASTTKEAPLRPSHAWEENYGDLVYDLFYSVLWNHKGASTLYLSYWNQMDRHLAQAKEVYQRYARAWVLKGAIELLLEGIPKHGRTLTPSEQVMLDANLNIPARLRQFESYLHKLNATDQVLLLLRDKYGLPYEEISPALGLTEGALKLKRQQALRAMEEWLWDRT